MKSLVEAALARQLDAVVVLGSNAEFPYLRFEEKLRVMGAAAEAAAGRIPVISTASAWSTDLAVDLAVESRKAGCDAVMAALPLYFKLDFKKALSHFQAVAEKGGLPVFYYHFPAVTGLDLSPARLAELAGISGVIGAKITVINSGYLRRAIEATAAQEWRVFTGTSFLLHDCLRSGGAGAFCPLTLIGTRDVRAIDTAFQRGDAAGAKKAQARVRLAIPLLTGSRLSPRLLARGFSLLARSPFVMEGRPGGSHGLLKEALRLQGVPITNRVRRPFEEVDQAGAELVRKTLERLSWLDKVPGGSG